MNDIEYNEELEPEFAEDDNEDFEGTEDEGDTQEQPAQLGLDAMINSLSYKDYTITKKRIKLSEIAVSKPLKVGRATTVVGLTKSVRELGVLVPIQVLTTDNDDDDFKYDRGGYRC